MAYGRRAKGRGPARSPRPKAENTSWTLRLPASLNAELRRWARDEGRSLNKQVVQLLKEAVAERRVQQAAPGPSEDDQAND
jgi:hypothetical protein